MKKTRFSITPYEKYSMLGMSENAFNVIDYVTDALKKEKLDVLVIPFQKKAIDGNHDNLMTIAQRYLDMANNAARKRKAEKFSRKHFAELADVNEAEAGILKAIHDAFMENKVDMLEGLEIDGHSLSLKAQGNRYYIGETYPDLWNIIKNTDMDAIEYKEEASDGIKELPKMLKKYLQNKYNMMLINDFVGIDFTDDVSQAVNFNIEPLVKVNFDKLSKEWWNEFSKNNREGVNKAAYKATKETLAPQEMFEILTLDPDMFDGFELIKAISDNTQEWPLEIPDSGIYVNKLTGAKAESGWSEIKDDIARILSDLEYEEEYSKYVTKEQWQEVRKRLDKYDDEIQNIINEMQEANKKLWAIRNNGGDKKAEKQIKNQMKKLSERKDIIDNHRQLFINDSSDDIFERNWEESKDSNMIPMSFDVLINDKESPYMEESANFEGSHWDPILGCYFGVLEEPHVYKSSLLEICCDDVQNDSALFF